MKDFMRDTRTSQEKVSVRYLRAENDRLKMNPEGCSSNKVLRCYFRKEMYS